ncbi:MAG: hypothetical protein H6831_14530 [Planctomycetes bacterium]|nr:hypothetical protein [Planctomycetota bacterium]MCB9905619.1 hypothetical protein [Planctomycetota bacterium]
MKTEKTPCESCSMPIESGPYCEHCVDEAGELQAFEERFERMGQWLRQREPGLEGGELEQRVLEFMSKMPAWRDHPRVKART